jgi:thioredoxin-like negative regulator of GroEL
LKVTSIPAVFLVYGGKIVDQFVGIPAPERLQEFFNKAAIIYSISSDENVRQTLFEQIEKILESGKEKEEFEQAFGILLDLYQYDKIREKHEYQIVTSMAYCLC